MLPRFNIQYNCYLITFSCDGWPATERHQRCIAILLQGDSSRRSRLYMYSIPFASEVIVA